MKQASDSRLALGMVVYKLDKHDTDSDLIDEIVSVLFYYPKIESRNSNYQQSLLAYCPSTKKKLNKITVHSLIVTCFKSSKLLWGNFDNFRSVCR